MENGPELVIHGHFYQPPRENPWTEEVGREASAAPFHDWNERIAVECYRPNAVARIVDDQDRVVQIVDNYAHLSYNVGPTLLSWLEKKRPEIYERILAGDREGGGAIAQAFGHSILPLATERDIRVQVRWGLADFAARFGRPAAGMWLPECAVNDTVLRILAEEGVGFTILAPGQAASLRPLDRSRSWVAVEASWLDTSRPYRWLHPDDDGKGVDIVFYNGPLSHAAAFEMSSLSSQGLVDRMLASSSGRGGLVTLATDGETFGHHHRYGDRLVAYALAVEAPRRGLAHTNLNRALENHRPNQEVRVHESAWSCAHGVGRWKEDCGCETGAAPGWNQRWRAPLRAALNTLKTEVDAIYDRRSATVFRDSTAALDDYVLVFTGARSETDFAEEHVVGDEVEAFTLLEMQRYGMAMFTSCGWFFNDLAGLETVQVLRYAARAMDLMLELGEATPRDEFLAILAEGRSNVPEQGTGADIWHRSVEPSRVGPERVVEHTALAEVLEHRAPVVFGPYDVTINSRKREQKGGTVLATGVAHLLHKRTGRSDSFAYAVVGLGGLELDGNLVRVSDSHDDAPLKKIRAQFASNGTVPALLRELSALGNSEFDLRAALPEEAERLMQGTAEALADRYSETYERLYDEHRAVLEDLTRHGYPLSPTLRAPAELALARRFQVAVTGPDDSTDPASYEDAISIARQARAAGFEVNSPVTTSVMQRLVRSAIRRAVDLPSAETVKVALDVLSLRNELGIPVDIAPSQEAVYFALTDDHEEALRPLAEALGLALPK